MCDCAEYDLYESVPLPQPAKVRRAELGRTRSEEPVSLPVESARRAPAVVAVEA